MGWDDDGVIGDGVHMGGGGGGGGAAPPGGAGGPSGGRYWRRG